MSFEILSLPPGLERDFVITVIATWYGAGLVAPLRAGLAVFATLPLAHLCLRSGRLPLALFGCVVLVLGFWVSEVWEITTGIKDDRLIVVDEVAAVLLGLALAGFRHWFSMAAFAAAFLGLDRLKPWPFDVLQVLPGGWGVMGDDLVLSVAIGVACRLIVKSRSATIRGT